MKGGPSVRCLSWMYPQEEASLTTLTNNRLHWWVAHPRGRCSEQNVSTLAPRTSQILLFVPYIGRKEPALKQMILVYLNGRHP